VVRQHVRQLEDRAVFETILSDHLRDVSLQDPADLRIRLRKDAQPNYPLLASFAKAAQERLARVARAQAALGEIDTSQRAVFGDNRCMQVESPVGGFDAVITSPPYETALPYIDTQRLSLVMFGHISRADIQRTERELTGCREISLRERRELEAQITAGDHVLPGEVTKLCRELLKAAAGNGNGFRRLNRPALTYRYFRNMAAFFTNLRRVMRPGGKVALVVGPSRTTLGKKEYVIDTPKLLSAIGRRCGFSVAMTVEMDTYQRYDLHQRNSIGSETLTVFEAPGR
jgi:site-specific DNA-methyltransferase (cytosine-N4-specific)